MPEIIKPGITRLAEKRVVHCPKCACVFAITHSELKGERTLVGARPNPTTTRCPNCNSSVVAHWSELKIHNEEESKAILPAYMQDLRNQVRLVERLRNEAIQMALEKHNGRRLLDINFYTTEAGEFGWMVKVRLPYNQICDHAVDIQLKDVAARLAEKDKL